MSKLAIAGMQLETAATNNVDLMIEGIDPSDRKRAKGKYAFAMGRGGA